MRKDKTHSRYFQAWKIVLFVVIVILIYICIYLCFYGNGFLSAGKELEKRDWLSFLGVYLSFVGTISVCLVATLQSSYYNKQENIRRKQERFEKIQPIFAIDIVNRNSHVGQYVIALNINDASTYPKYDNFTIKIENIGEYPAMHICVFEKYMFPAIKVGDAKQVQAAFSDSEDVKKYPKGLNVVLDCDEPRDEEYKLPLEFNICYEDIDGNSLFQTFKLSDIDGVKYYSLKRREITIISGNRGD